MSIKGTSKEWFVGKEKSNIYNFWYNKTSFHYNELDSITYYYPNGSKPGNVSFNKRSHEVINFKFKEKASAPVYRAMKLIRENNPDLKVEEMGGVKSESGTAEPPMQIECDNEEMYTEKQKGAFGVKIVGILLIIVGVIGIAMGTIMYGDIGIACMVGAVSALLSGVGFMLIEKRL